MSSVPFHPEPAIPQNDLPARERRRTPRGRRARDKLFQHDSRRESPDIARQGELQNLLLLVEDDLRESALALQAVEAYLCKAQASLSRATPLRVDLYNLSEDAEVVDRLDILTETLLSLRKRLGVLGDALP